ncbi:hypothetical protein LR48_Vigan04g225300 [Vigna angularis]|uniref:Myb/SANT-like domain-containing protein n=1 Tax=Phaseolus angularis TaxID=3914 RepID=A0A0L9UGQ2_PHAAN|nr:hypothetical protein LR48_Vigan04g225300 [Vigna angularis]
MNRGKAAAIPSSGPTKEFMKWTEDMDARLLHCMIEESRMGNRVDGSWTTQAYTNIVDNLHSAGYVAVTKNNVKNRQKVLKDKWRESRPAAAKWRVNSIKHYDLMVELWATDRATGSGVRTARQARRQRVGPHVSVDLNQNIEYIPEQSQWTGYRDPTPPSPPPSVDEYSPGQTQSVPSVPSGGTSSSRGSKRKAPMVDSIDTQFDKLTTSLDGFANVLNSSNVHFGVISDAAVRQVSVMEDRNEILRSQTEILRRTPNYTYTEADIYEMLTAMNISDENLLEQCYDFLCRNPTCTKRLMGLPPHKRWNKLWKMISGDGIIINKKVKKNLSAAFFKPADWLTVANLKYDGKKLCYSNIPDDFPYDRDMTLATMVIPDLEGGQGVLTVGCLNINDRLLHYIIVHMLTPRPGNFARLLHEDIFMIWVLKNNIPNNWPYHRMQHMLKCKVSDTALPYGVLITHIMQYCGVDVSTDPSTQIGSRHHFSINSLKRMKIVYVNGAWQHDLDDDEEEDQPHPHQNPVQPPPALSNANMITQMWEGVQDLRHRMQGMEQMQVRVQRIEDNLANLSLDMNCQFANLNQNVNSILHHLDD